ncbi:MAG: tetratricopeptide repeat protein, partial [Myxococcaceae bacterium]|nr:tetratricopeptide repeat protein [Myxococcaceae bacterium]
EQRFAQAVALARTALAAELPGALHAFARFQLGRGELAQAQPLLAEARRLLVEARGDGAKVLLARVHQDEGDLASSQGQLQIAAQSYALAIDVLGEREHGDDLETVEPSRRLAATLARTGRAAEACELLAQLVELLEAAQGGAHPSVGVVLSDLATATWAMGKADEVEPLYRRALSMLEPRPEGVELYLANVLTQLGSLALYGKNERLEEAQRLYHRALAITEVMLGKEHPEVATLFKHLAVAHMKAEELERAEPLARAALRIEDRFDASGFRALNAASILGSILFQRGQHAAAVPLLERTVRGLTAAQAPANVLGPIEQQLAEAKSKAAR